jgi:RsiW-degrading membrane proteinase PrsW (M82 family)
MCDFTSLLILCNSIRWRHCQYDMWSRQSGHLLSSTDLQIFVFFGLFSFLCRPTCAWGWLDLIHRPVCEKETFKFVIWMFLSTMWKYLLPRLVDFNLCDPAVSIGLFYMRKICQYALPSIWSPGWCTFNLTFAGHRYRQCFLFGKIL